MEKTELKGRKRDLYNGKLMGLQPRLAKLDWIIEACRPYSGSAQHGALVDSARNALFAGMAYQKYTRMLAYPAGATTCRGDTARRVEENWQRSAADFSLAEHKALELYKKLFKE